MAAEGFPVQASGSSLCVIVSFCFFFLSFFRSAREVTCGEAAERREELPRLLSASVWSLRRHAQ